MEDIDIKTILPLLQDFGISPEQLGPQRMGKLMELAQKIKDPSTITPETSNDIMKSLGIDLNGPKEQKKSSRINRNAPCSCNSGKKYKKCCGI
tara:strand:- start:251 stop:529 length:279 start_codon:yes stop_codon:yes gene_type:complete